MASNTAAIIVACISGGISITVAILAAWARGAQDRELEKLRGDQKRKLQDLKAEKDRELQNFKAEKDRQLHDLKAEKDREPQGFKARQDTKLETLKGSHNWELGNLRHTLQQELQRDLGVFRDSLLQRREEQAKKEAAEKLFAKYRDPLLRSAYDLQSRIYNIYALGFAGKFDTKYFRDKTLFVLAEFLGWLEILRHEMRFLDLGAEEVTKNLRLSLDEIQNVLASQHEWGRRAFGSDDFYVYRGQQRAIGELMTTRLEGDSSGHRRLVAWCASCTLLWSRRRISRSSRNGSTGWARRRRRSPIRMTSPCALPSFKGRLST
jgi:hypothetical protein